MTAEFLDLGPSFRYDGVAGSRNKEQRGPGILTVCKKNDVIARLAMSQRYSVLYGMLVALCIDIGDFQGALYYHDRQSRPHGRAASRTVSTDDQQKRGGITEADSFVARPDTHHGKLDVMPITGTMDDVAFRSQGR